MIFFDMRGLPPEDRLTFTNDGIPTSLFNMSISATLIVHLYVKLNFMRISDLKPNKRNPRRMSDKKREMLQASLKKFGDLSGFVYNRRSKSLIGGHQKQRVIPPKSPIKIEQKYETPTACLTVAEGYVLIEGERFKYREVDADAEWEVEAMIAANKHQGEWDHDILKLNAADFKGMNWELAGFEIAEVKEMGITGPVFPASLIQSPVLPSLSLNTTSGEPEASKAETKEETDEDYVNNTPQTTERIPTEGEKLNANPFEKIEEKTEVPGRRIVIIIDCPNEAVKKDLREKLRTQVEESGGKYF